MMQTKTIPNHLLLPEVSKMVAAGQHVKIRVKGVSMIPFLYGGRDEVILSPFREAELQPGVIILAFLPDTNRYVLHRIVRRNQSVITLMGDGNVRGTETCTVDDVRAKVCKVVRNGKSVDLSSPFWMRNARRWSKLLPIRRYLLWLFRSFEEPSYLITGIKRKIKLI